MSAMPQRQVHSTFRRSTAYPCACWPCDQPGAWVEAIQVRPNGMPTSLAFYGYCEEHYQEATK